MPKNELIDVFDELMRPLGTASRDCVHSLGLWHHTFHCWIVTRTAPSEDYSLVFQMRSSSKDIQPNSLDISAAGHLVSGETPIQGTREVREELGIDFKPEDLRYLGVHLEVYRDDRHINREFQHVYLIVSDCGVSKMRIDPEELSDILLLPISEGILLFSGKKENTVASRWTSCGAQGTSTLIPSSVSVKVADFAGGHRNNYFLKVLLLSRAAVSGETLLII